MWYVIAALVGVAIGVGLLIWGLRERRLRYEAEKKLVETDAQVGRLLVEVHDLKKQAGALEDERAKVDAQVVTLRRVVDELRTRLVACADVKAIKSWLMKELGEEEIK